jgi:hypothetical protein
MEPNVRRILRFMLATGQRKAEVVGLRADEIDLEKTMWLLPAVRAKNGREHLVPLSRVALEILAETAPNDQGFIFPSARTAAPYRGQSIDHATRYLFDAKPQTKGRKSETKPARLAGKADLGMVVHRDPAKDQTRTDIYVRKVRFKSVGKIGVASLRYDRATGRYAELTPTPSYAAAKVYRDE